MPNGPVLVRIDNGHGDATLPSFNPKGRVLYVTFVCLGPGKFSLGTWFDFSPCTGQSATSTVTNQAGKTVTLQVSANSKMTWRVMIQDGS